MRKHVFGSVAVAAALVALPAYAATTQDTNANSPAAANPASPAPAPDTTATGGTMSSAHTTAEATAPSERNGSANNQASGSSASDHSTASDPTNQHATPIPDTHAAGTATGPQRDQNANTTPKYTTSDDQVRAAKIVGATVYNDKDESVGTVDDVLMSHDNKATTAVISVGGFLGMGSKLVSVPFDQLKIEKDRIVMPGATKDALKGMPEYKYNNA